MYNEYKKKQNPETEAKSEPENQSAAPDLTKRGNIRILPERRAEINRENSLHSTGPRTPDGKARSAMNAVNHGCCSPNIYLEPGEEESYDNHRRDLYLVLRPVSPEEKHLADRMIQMDWQLKRSIAKEISAPLFAALKRPEVAADLTTLKVAECEFLDHIDNPKGAAAMESLGRHRSRIERDYIKLRNEYRLIRAERLKEKNEPTVDDGFDENSVHPDRPQDGHFQEHETVAVSEDLAAFTLAQNQNRQNEATGNGAKPKPNKDDKHKPIPDKHGYVHDWVGWRNNDKTWCHPFRQERYNMWGQERFPWNPDGGPRPFWGDQPGDHRVRGPRPETGHPLFIEPKSGWAPHPKHPDYEPTPGRRCDDEEDNDPRNNKNEATGNVHSWPHNMKGD